MALWPAGTVSSYVWVRIRLLWGEKMVLWYGVHLNVATLMENGWLISIGIWGTLSDKTHISMSCVGRNYPKKMGRTAASRLGSQVLHSNADPSLGFGRNLQKKLGWFGWSKHIETPWNTMRHQRFPYPIRPIAGSFTLFVEKFIADYDLRTKDRPNIGGVSPVKLW